MSRLVASLVVLAACSDSAPATSDAARDAVVIDAHVALRTTAFTILACTSGVPGDASCPINFVQLDSLGARAAGARLGFVLRQIDGDFYLDRIKLDGTTTLHLLSVAFEQAGGTALVYIEEIDPRITLGPLPTNAFTPTSTTIRV